MLTPVPRPAAHTTPRRRSLRSQAGACLLAALLAACGHASHERPAVLAGQVVDEKGEGLAGATVFLFARDGEQPFAEATTDDEGRFTVELADRDPVDVRVGKAWQVQVDREEDIVWWHTLTAEALGVLPGGAPSRLVAEVSSRDASVRVQVSSTAGRVAQVKVRAVPTVWPADAVWWWAPGYTNEIGRVDLDELPRVPVALRVEHRSPWCPTRGPVVLPDALGLFLHRIVVERERILEGRVLDAEGRGVAGLGVMVTSDRDTPSRPWGDVTGTDGRFCVGVPESWEDATLLVGCVEPAETSACAFAVPLTCADEEPLEIRLADSAVGGTAVGDVAAYDEARRVTEAVLRAHYVRKKQRALVLEPELGGLEHGRDVRTYLDAGVDDSTVADLARKAHGAATLPATLDLGVPTVRLPARWWRYLGEVHGDSNQILWKHFYARFPGSGGLVVVSPVAFSEDGNQAVIHVVEVRGRMNADGYWHLLEKRGDAWCVVRRQMTWIS